MKYDVYALGNALVDLEYKVEDDFLSSQNIEKGLMTLVDEKRQQDILKGLDEHKFYHTHKQCGGSAANTVIAISQFGGRSYYACRVAGDEFGKFYLDDLDQNGVNSKVPSSFNENTGAVTGRCVVMVSPDAQRTMNTFLGATAEFATTDVDFDELKQSKWLYLEGYLVASPTGFQACKDALKFAKDNGIKTAITLSDPSMVQAFRAQFDELLKDGVDLLFANEDEAKELAGTTNMEEARTRIKAFAERFAITLGANGALIWDGETFVDIEPFPTEAIDTNGAGDLFAGAFMYGISNGHTYAGSGKLASLASSRLVNKFGTRLNLKEIREVYDHVFKEQ